MGWQSVLNLFVVAVTAFASYYGWWKGGNTFERMKARTARLGIGRGPSAGDSGVTAVELCVIVTAVCLIILTVLALGSGLHVTS
jgi:hypothetical protein